MVLSCADVPLPCILRAKCQPWAHQPLAASRPYISSSVIHNPLEHAVRYQLEPLRCATMIWSRADIELRWNKEPGAGFRYTGLVATPCRYISRNSIRCLVKLLSLPHLSI